ncbi:MAG TPA: putative sugar O-methyltransferase [Vineibacter sp.]|nr:putative sugar O-methyltransferase [Vineibacter sp.]
MKSIGEMDSLFQPSRFWSDLAAQNLRMLETNGVANFKRSVAQNYFNWAVEGPSDPQMRALLAAWAADPSPLPLAADLRGSAALTGINGLAFLRNASAVRAYTLFVGLLWWYASRGDDAGIAARLSEPRVGNPVGIEIDGRPISQDLANALREYSRLRPYLTPDDDAPRPVLAEIGAGYGRLGAAVLQAQPARYWIFDIPPALAIAEWYLSEVFTDRKVFRWRPFTSWSEVSAEAAEADIALFTVDQLPMVPDGMVRCFAAISALHEMRPEQIEAFMALMGRKSTRALYTKNWSHWRNEADAFDFSSDLLVPSSGWDKAFDRADDVLLSFTEKLFVRRGGSEVLTR